MKTAMKKVLCMAMALLLLIGIFPMTALAAGPDEDGRGDGGRGDYTDDDRGGHGGGDRGPGDRGPNNSEDESNSTNQEMPEDPNYIVYVYVKVGETSEERIGPLTLSVKGGDSVSVYGAVRANYLRQDYSGYEVSKVWVWDGTDFNGSGSLMADPTAAVGPVNKDIAVDVRIVPQDTIADNQPADQTYSVKIHVVDEHGNALGDHTIDLGTNTTIKLLEQLAGKYEGDYAWFNGEGQQITHTGDISVKEAADANGVYHVTLKVIQNTHTITAINNDGTDGRTTYTAKDKTNILDNVTATPTREGYQFIRWNYDVEGKNPVAVNDTCTEDVTIYAEWKEVSNHKPDNKPDGDRPDSKPDNGRPDTRPDDKPSKDDTYTVVVDYNYPRDYDDNMTIDGVEFGTRMANVLRVVEDPSGKRDGYFFDYWAWDSEGDHPVDDDDLVERDCKIYAIWSRKHYVDNEITLRIYLNGNTRNAAKVVDMDKYARDGKITLSEVKEVIYNYYTAKNSKGLDIDGLYTSRLWNDGDYSWKNAVKSIEIERHDDNVIYVMVRNAQSHTEATADSSNPKTGDMIMTPVIVLGASAACLAALFFLNKKRAV